ncbi:lantibiotic dehydratase [Actinosynnema sp. NPDC053489]|uniref:lantibiotic dehydratase n=1 Tax=Actinosynnema sp. NPDC053489 TaxID=3363916 RepID=UPI0037C8D904
MCADKGFVHYQHHGTGLLRATAEVIDVRRWPDPDDEQDCRSWLVEAWPLPGIAPAIRHASPVLATRVETILSGDAVAARDVRRATLSVVRYVLRARGRPTPFGTFAGVSTLAVGTSTDARLGTGHRPVVRAETRWLHRVVQRLEDCAELVARLDVTVNDAAELRAGRWELPGPRKVSVRATSAVAMVRDEAAVPIGFGVLSDKLAHAFPEGGDASAMLMSLLRNGLLLTSLRATGTVTDPLAFLVERLRDAGSDSLPIAPLAEELNRIHRAITEHNHTPSEQARVDLASRMREVADSVRVPLSVDLRLDAHVQLPQQVVREMQRAAGVLARLTRETTGSREWREWFAAFCERYGTGTLIPLRMVLDRDGGIGLPRGYPGSPRPAHRHVFSARDELLLALAAEATALGQREVELDEALVEKLAAASGERGTPPPHVDLGARIHAANAAALDRGEFTLTVSPGRAAGTLTSRFTTLVPEAGLAAIFAALPTTTAGAAPVQLSFSPIYPAAENVCRVPAYLPDVVSIGEHVPDGAIRVDDLAITATHRRLHLVDLPRRRVVEPQVLHALAPKQQPAMARLVGELSRALDVGWIGFDWGAADALPFRPRVRYGRVILSAARWRLVQADLPMNPAEWDQALHSWRTTWRCPARVELRDFDQLLPLDLDVSAHRTILYRHLRKHSEAVLLEAADPDADGWLSGHPHTVVLPLTSVRVPEPAPAVEVLPILTREHGHLPGSASSSWLYAKLYLSAGRMDHLLVHELPALLAALGDRACWFVRYPQAREGEEPDQLRLRVRVHRDTPGDTDQTLAAVTAWADRLRAEGLIGRLAFDTYFPEVGRYIAMNEAEEVFTADSHLVLAQLTHLAPDTVAPTVLTGLSMFDMAAAFLGSRAVASDWLSTPATPAAPDRAEVNEVTRLVRDGWQAGIPGWSAVSEAHRQRADALARYRGALPEGVDIDRVLHSLLHMHHNRALGVNRDREAICLRLARQAAAAWRTTQDIA